MTKQEFLRGIEKLELAYSRKFSTEQLKLWYSKLKDINYTKFENKIDETITRNTYMPSLAEFTTEQKNTVGDYEQRDYSNFDFSKLYANPMA